MVVVQPVGCGAVVVQLVGPVVVQLVGPAVVKPVGPAVVQPVGRGVRERRVPSSNLGVDLKGTGGILPVFGSLPLLAWLGNPLSNSRVEVNDLI